MIIRSQPIRKGILNRNEKDYQINDTVYTQSVTESTLIRPFILVTRDPKGIPPYAQIPTAAISWV
jgi:hypothetical protein